MSYGLINTLRPRGSLKTSRVSFTNFEIIRNKCIYVCKDDFLDFVRPHERENYFLIAKIYLIYILQLSNPFQVVEFKKLLHKNNDYLVRKLPKFKQSQILFKLVDEQILLDYFVIRDEKHLKYSCKSSGREFTKCDINYKLLLNIL